MSTESPKKSSKLPMILAGCGCLLFAGLVVGGIMASIAIPAFNRYVQKSKAVEARTMLTSMANAAATYYRKECTFPPTAAASSETPKSGDRVASSFTGKGWDELSNIAVSNENYFAYQTSNKGKSFEVSARADFDPGGPVHEAKIIVTGTRGESDDCSAEIGSFEVENELE